MALGPGKYDDLATHCIEQAHADAVVLIVWNGNRGSGISGKEISTDFDVVVNGPRIQRELPGMLRAIATSIERDTREN